MFAFNNGYSTMEELDKQNLDNKSKPFSRTQLSHWYKKHSRDHRDFEITAEGIQIQFVEVN